MILWISALASLSFGTADISMTDTAKILLNSVHLLPQSTIEEIKPSHMYIIWQVRLPRILIAIITGMALSVAGAVFQALFRNPMADPYVLGISSGAAFGVALGTTSGFLVFFTGPWGISFCAFVGAMGTSILIFMLSGGLRSSSNTLLLSGVALSFLLSAGLSLLMYFNRDQVEEIVYWMLGSFSSANWEKVQVIIPLITLGVTGILLFSRDLDLLLLGENTAKTLGVDSKKIRMILLILATAITASAVAISGIIGFVGLVIPHIIRILTGPKHNKLLPHTILAGGIFTLVADTLARGMIPMTEIPVGIITSLSGAPFFIYLLRRRKGDTY